MKGKMKPYLVRLDNGRLCAMTGDEHERWVRRMKRQEKEGRERFKKYERLERLRQKMYDDGLIDNP